MDLSVVIVTYNSARVIAECLNCLESAEIYRNGEIIVVDNSSSDETIDLVKSQFPQVRIISCNHNTGFAKACNAGVGLSSGKYLLFINPDAYVNMNCLGHCVDFLQRHPQAGIVGCRLVAPDGSIQQSWGGFPTISSSVMRHLLRTPSHVRPGPLWAKAQPDDDMGIESDWLMGAFLMTRRCMYPTNIVFDESYFLYGEDMDLCFRVRSAGWNVILVASASAIHAGQSHWNMSRYERVYAAYGLFYRKHRGYAYSVLATLLLLVLLAIRSQCDVFRRMARGGVTTCTRCLDTGVMLLLRSIRQTHVARSPKVVRPSEMQA